MAVHVPVVLGPEGERLTLEAMEAASGGGELPRVVADWRRWRPLKRDEGPLYRVPPRGWRLYENGVSYVVRRGGRTVRVVAVFLMEPPAPLSQRGFLVVSRQPRGWLATFEEE